MLARLKRSRALLDDAALTRFDHALIVLPFGRDADALPEFPQRARLEAALRRRKMKFEDLGKTPLALHLEHGGLCAYVMVDRNKPRFEQLTTLRKAIASLLDEQPRGIAIGVFGDEALRQVLAREALYVAWINGVRLPVRKSKDEGRPLERISLFGAGGDFDDLAALARANTLARELTVLPPNELTPKRYRERLRQIARSQHWHIEEFDYGKLSKMGAGAFTAVAQGSDERDAAIVHLSYAPKNAQLTVALVGKGICFDTGGHNLKTAKYMAGMHEDMNGSAVALGLMQALAEQDFPLRVDAWLALAQNHLSPAAYKQNDIVTALDGTTIEDHAHRRRRAHGAGRHADHGEPRGAQPDRQLRHPHRQHALCPRHALFRHLRQRGRARTVGGRGGPGQRRAGLPVPDGCRLRGGAGVQGGGRQAMHPGRRRRPHPGGTLSQALHPRQALAARGSFRLQQQRWPWARWRATSPASASPGAWNCSGAGWRPSRRTPRGGGARAEVSPRDRRPAEADFPILPACQMNVRVAEGAVLFRPLRRPEQSRDRPPGIARRRAAR